MLTNIFQGILQSNHSKAEVLQTPNNCFDALRHGMMSCHVIEWMTSYSLGGTSLEGL
jgi:hypothetical protein